MYAAEIGVDYAMHGRDTGEHYLAARLTDFPAYVLINYQKRPSPLAAVLQSVPGTGVSNFWGYILKTSPDLNFPYGLAVTPSD